MVEVTGLLKNYPNFSLSINNLKFKEAGIVGIAGNNGSGKTTFLRALCDLLPLDSGTVLYDEQIATGSEKWKAKTGIYLGEDFLPGFLTPTEYWQFVTSFSETAVITEIPPADLLPFLDFNFNEKKKKIRDFSQGNKDKIGIVAAFINKPTIIILDEPFAHLDPKSQSLLVKIMQELSNRVLFLITSHNIPQLITVSNRLIIFNNGSVIKDVAVNENTHAEVSVLLY